MGQVEAHGCCGCGGAKEVSQQHEARIVPVHSIELEGNGSAHEADANEALLEAVSLARKGMYAEAMDRLLQAECLIDELPASPTASQLKRAFFTDPELQEIKIRSPKRSRQLGPRPLTSFYMDSESSPGSSPKVPFAAGGPPHLGEGAMAFSPAPPEVATQLAALESELQAVQDLCCRVHIFEAYEALEKVERKARGAVVGGSDALTRAFQSKLSADPQLMKLRNVFRRMSAALTLAASCANAVSPPPVVINDPSLGEKFRLELSMRPAAGDERDPKGPVTQLIAVCKISNFPLSLENMLSVDCENDLFKKEWIKDCKSREAACGGPDALYSCMTRYQVAMSPLPIHLEEVQIREFAICDSAPLPGLRPGVLVLESGPTVESGAFENWTVPKPSGKHGCYRLAAATMVNYKMQSLDDPNGCDIVTIRSVGLPVPQWLLPMDTFKGIVAEKIRGSLKILKAELVDHFGALAYEDRKKHAPRFYEAVRAVSALKPTAG